MRVRSMGLIRAAALIAVLASAETVARQAVAAPVAGCIGDCGGDGAVTISDLVLGVNIALGIQPIGTCTAMDGNGNGSVTVDELIRAVAAALNGCPPPVTATETAAAAPSDTPPASSTATSEVPTPSATETVTALDTVTPTVTPAAQHFCDLAGSYQSTAPGVSVVTGGASVGSALNYLHLPIGFCAHFFARVGNPRDLRFAPSGELFVSSPSHPTTGGGQFSSGAADAILVLADDDGDGVAELTRTFLKDQQGRDVVLKQTVGLLFANGYLYYQDGTRIMRVPYTPGDRTTMAASEQVADITIYVDGLHWPKTLDMADDGTIYVGNGSYENEGNPGYPECYMENRPFRGGILKLDGSPGGTPVAKGFRNPISVKCQRGHNLCFAIELAKDYSYGQGGREKIIPIHDGDDWGFPCCASKDLPYSFIQPPPDCSHVSKESDSFYIGNTPFDLDFETGKWPEPWKNRAFVPLHGAAGTWTGARVVAIDSDSMSGQLLPGSDLTGMSDGAMVDFATGWNRDTLDNVANGRPAVVAFAEDGRLFLANDYNGDIIWIAPLDLPIPR